MQAAPSHNELRNSIILYLTSRNLQPTATWLRTVMPSIKTNTPLLASQKTALFRLLASDLTTSVQASSQNSVFPADITNPATKEVRLPGPIPVQVLDIEDIGHSRWSQVESIEAQERGEMTKGREVIRVVPESETSTSEPSNSTSSGPHKLLLQDAQGSKVYGFELNAVEGMNLQKLSIGAKLVLKDVVVARGLILLEPRSVEVLGGKVEVWEKKWRSERKEGLKRKAGLGDEQPG